MSTVQHVDTMLEEVERALDVQMRTLLPGTLDEVASEMVAADGAYFVAIGADPAPETPLPPPATYQLGHDPLVLEHPLKDYPILTSVCYQHPLEGEAPEQDVPDQAEVVRTVSYVEAMVVSGDRSLVERQAKRYAKAMQRVIQKDFTLGGTCERQEVTPQVEESNTVASSADDLGDSVIYFKGVRLSYTFRTLKSFYW